MRLSQHNARHPAQSSPTSFIQLVIPYILTNLLLSPHPSQEKLLPESPFVEEILMSFKRVLTFISLIAGGAVISWTNPAKAYTFTTANVTAADVLDFRQMGYSYSSLGNQGAGLQVRKSTSEMTGDEISRFVNALTTLKNTFETTAGGVRISVYDQFVATHLATMDMTGRLAPDGSTLVNGAHGNASFLPWHRQFLYEFEKALQTVDPTVSIPYWDWTDRNATNALFQNNFLGPNGGTNGVGGGAVMTGAFSTAQGWTVRSDLSSSRWRGVSTRTQALTRNLGAATALGTQTQVNQALNQTNYLNFRRVLEAGTGLHNATHNWFGTGSLMRTQSSPNDPAFWLLHANVDRLWAQWQLSAPNRMFNYPATGQPYGHNLNDPMFPWNLANIPIANDLKDLLPTLPGQQNNTTSLDPSLFTLASTTDELLASEDGYMYNPWGHHANHGGDGYGPLCDMEMLHHEEYPVCDELMGQSVPEPGTVAGILTFSALGFSSFRKRKSAQKVS